MRAGSEQYPGAGVLCVAGASAGLVGMVRYLGGAADLVRAKHPEVVVGEGRVQAWVIGSGGGADAEQALADSLADGVPVVVDADGLTHVDGPLGVPALLTPHAGELARMLGVEREQVEAEQLEYAREAARRYDAMVLLKGRHTLVARPTGEVRVTTVGPAWLATAGAGDVLAGLCGALVAAGLEPVRRRLGRLVAARHGGGRGGARRPGHRPRGRAGLPTVLRTLLHPDPATPALPTLPTRRLWRRSVARVAGSAGCGARVAGSAGFGRMTGDEPARAEAPPRPKRAPRSSSTSTRSATTSATLKARVGDAAMMTVVKADGYGHGLVESGRAARAGGADWLGTAVVEEALALRAAGDTGRILTWLTVPGEDYTRPIEADVDLTAYTVDEVDEIAAAARALGVRARVQLKVDTGLSRGGATAEDWPALVAAAADAEQVGALRVTGIWSHFACSDEPDHPANDAQEKAFVHALQVVDAVGIEPEVRHLSNSAGALLRPWSSYDLVRCGIASYGLSPAPDVVTSAELGLVPAMTARARLALVKHVPAGTSVSYGHTWTAPRGHVPRAGAGRVRRRGAPARLVDRRTSWSAGTQRQVAGRVCMDQLVRGPRRRRAAAGDPVVLFGSGRDGAPTAQDWARGLRHDLL